MRLEDSVRRTVTGNKPPFLASCGNAFLSILALCAAAFFATPLPAQENGPPADRRNAVPVSLADAMRDPASGRYRITVAKPDRSELAPVVSTLGGAAAATANRLFRSGRAVGLGAVLYDNRDSDHSRPDLGQFPQLRETRYGEDAAERGLGRGLPGAFVFDIPVIGNASLALTKGPFKRSLARVTLQDQRAAMNAYQLFRANHLYVYPEHRDHDAKTGDLFPAQTPYMIVSQGSSYSDKPFLNALFLTYAAFPPETFDKLRGLGLLPATAQMILRRTAAGIRSPAQYLSPRAHPTVFDGDALRPTAMVALAAAMKPTEIPPMVTLRMTQDFQARAGTDYLAENLSEYLFTTPSAIARVWRSFAGQRRFAVSAEQTQDPNGHPVSFHWVLLRGDPSHVSITPAGTRNETAEITIDWHQPDQMQGPTGIAASRVEIGVFADNGFHLSAPAFVSIALPPHQDRSYAGRGAAAQLWSVNYRAGENYVDPLLWPIAPWDDRLSHEPDGQISILTRRKDNVPQPYSVSREPGRHLVARGD